MNPRGAKFWRSLGFLTVFGLSTAGVTFVFWHSPQPSADTVVTTTTSGTVSPVDTSSTVSPSGITATTVTVLPSALKVAASLSTNTAYGISGSASFTDLSTVVIRGFSITGNGPKVEIQLRDSSDQTLGTLKDISKLSYANEDLVLAVPSTVSIESVASIAIVAPDFGLKLSSATW